ncbi:MAG: class I SAM-dependent methyltransferase [Candidatus Omnitrophica bacterium]|nr:class I SAM-dependent methyltransferase [Candidatus Omnitrophota bacterium]
MRPYNRDLKEICEQAMKTGLKIDLSDCLYGETTGSCAFINRPTSYYFFLSGFVMTQRLTRILEIGTNCGGSIMSISKGLHKDDIERSRLVTVDIAHKNEEGFIKYPHISRIHGDSLDEEVVKKVSSSFDRNIDLLYIDSLHEYKHTKENINIYTDKLDPAYVILDDIRQCDEMKKLWGEMQERFKDNAFDASDITIRSGAGFGIIRT